MSQTAKLCLVATAGGHLAELLELESIWADRAHFYVTTASENIPARFLASGRVYKVPFANRWSPRRIIEVSWRCVTVLTRERPQVIISTGCCIGALFCIIGKLTGRRVVFVETMARTSRLSMSGQLVRPFADLFLVQWPELREKYAGTTYAGSII